MQNIVTGNDFTLIVDARRQETASQRFDLRVLERLEIYLVMAGRAKVLQSYTLDESGRAVIEVGGDALPVGVWGVELVGTYQMANVRSTNAKAFKIVDGLNQLGLSGDGIEIVVEVNVLSNAEATRPYVDAAIADHDADVTSHSDIRTALAQKVSDIKVDGISIVDGNKVANLDSDDFGKVDDVKVNGVSVVSNKEAAITMPTKVSDLANDSQFTTKSYVDGEVAQAGHVDDVQVNGTSVVSGKVASVNVPTKVSDLPNDADYRNATQVQTAINTAIDANFINEGVGTVDGTTGTPSVDIVKDGTILRFAFHNIKGAPFTFADFTPEQKEELRGEQGATGVYDQTTQDFLTTLETTTGQSQTKTMTQKAITDELINDRVYSLAEIDIAKYIVSRWIINSSGAWSRASKTTTGSSYIFEINPGETFKVNFNLPANTAGNVEFLKTYNGFPNSSPDPASPDFAGRGRIGWLEDYLDTYYFTAPEDAHYMYIRGLAGSGDDRTPTYVGKVTKTKDLIDEIPSLLSTKPQSLSEGEKGQARDNLGMSEAVNGGKANYLHGVVYSASSQTAYVIANATGCNVLTEYIPVGAGTKAIWYFGQQVGNTVAQAIIYDSNKQPISFWNMGVDNVAKGYRDISYNYNAGYIRFSFFDNDINGNPLELVAEVNGVKYYKHGTIASIIEEKDKHWKPLILGELIPYYINENGNIGIQSNARAAMHDMLVFPKPECRLRFKAPSDDFFIKVWEYNSKGGAPWEARNPRTQGKWFFDGDTYTVPSDKSCYRIMFTLRDAEMTEGYIQSLIDSGQIAIEYYDGDESNLFDRNAYMENFARNAMRRLINPRTTAGIKASNPNNIPTFAHLSDVHGDAARLKNFIEYAKYLGVDGIVNTGDTCNYIHSHGATFQNVLSEGCGNYLFAVGNHDAKELATGEDVFADIMEPLVEGNGYLEGSSTPTTHTYWFRDFDAKGIRVIAIDYYATGYPGLGQAQLSWFVSTLAATPAGYGVIVLMHSPEDAVEAAEGYDKFMQPLPKYGDVFEPSGTYVGEHPIRAIVDAFIVKGSASISYTDNGESVSVTANFSGVDTSTEFIAYMVGHRHEDNVGYYTKYAESHQTQLCLGVVCGTGMYGDASHAAWANQSDLMRGDIGVTQDAFNVYGIDREKGEVRIARIGATVTERMEVRDYMIIPYK